MGRGIVRDLAKDLSPFLCSSFQTLAEPCGLKGPPPSPRASDLVSLSGIGLGNLHF